MSVGFLFSFKRINNSQEEKTNKRKTTKNLKIKLVNFEYKRYINTLYGEYRNEENLIRIDGPTTIHNT